jgi:hypothetical protein
MITGTENSASEGKGRNDLIQARNRLSTTCLASQSEIGLAMAMKAASVRKYSAAKAYVTGFRIRFTANSPGKSKSREFERFLRTVRRGVSFDRTGQLP